MTKMSKVSKVAKKVAKEVAKEVVLNSFVTIGISDDGSFIWSAKNVTNLFEVLGYIELAKDDIKKKITEISSLPKL